MCKKVNSVLNLDLLVANNGNQQYPKIRSCFQKSRNGIQRGFIGRTGTKNWEAHRTFLAPSGPQSAHLFILFSSKIFFLLFLVHMIEYGCPHILSLKTNSSQPHRHQFSFLILIPNSWEVESDWPSPGSAMLEGRVSKYTSSVRNLLLWMEQSRGDRRQFPEQVRGYCK